jgi:S1-C subfamily serine protease
VCDATHDRRPIKSAAPLLQVTPAGPTVRPAGAHTTEETLYSDLYRSTIPSVVSIYLADDGRPAGAGSGFVHEATPDGDGYVVTNEHVVRDGESVDVRFDEGEWRTGDVAGTDVYTDLAVVRVPDLPAGVRPLALADGPPTPGARVAALGTPMGLDGSITSGIVSGANRSMPTREGFAIPDTVRTDAAITPGNSGGPLVAAGDDDADAADPSTVGDGDGPMTEVVGVNRARGGDNIGFAVSADVVARVVPALIEDGEYRHSYLKVRTLDVSPTVAEANDLDDSGGVLVDVSLGPASGALRGARGTRTVRGREVPAGGDVIVSVDGSAVDSHEELMRYLLLDARPGDEVELELVRDGRRIVEHVTLAERPRAEGGDRRRRRNVPVR